MHAVCLFFTATELGSVLEEREGLSTRCEQLERRTEAMLTDYEQEKRDKFAAKVRGYNYSQHSMRSCFESVHYGDLLGSLYIGSSVELVHSL